MFSGGLAVGAASPEKVIIWRTYLHSTECKSWVFV